MDGLPINRAGNQMRKPLVPFNTGNMNIGSAGSVSPTAPATAVPKPLMSANPSVVKAPVSMNVTGKV